MSHNGSADSVLSVQAQVMEGVCRQHCVCEYKGDSFFSHMFFPKTTLHSRTGVVT